MKLSIITINYNNHEGLHKTIDSVISQTWQEFEWIIVDGGSTDGSRGLIEQTASLLESRGWTATRFSGPGDPACSINNQSLKEHLSLSANLTSSHRILWCSEPDKGIYNAMNKGIIRSQGDYCLFLNSGDWLYASNVLHSVFDLMEKEIDVFVGRVFCEGQGESRAYSKINSLFLLQYQPYPHQASFIKRQLFIRYGFYDESFRIVSDWLFLIKAIVHGTATVDFSNLIIAGMQEGGLSTNQDMLKAEGDVLRKSEFSKLLIEDLRRSQYLAPVMEASWFTRKAYSVLYRISGIILHLKKL